MGGTVSIAPRIHQIYQRIAQLDNLTINDQALSLFNELLEILRTHSDSALLSTDPYLQAIAPPLRRIFANAAYLYEKFWAEQLLAKTDLAEALANDYPYHEHYIRATRLEFQTLAACYGKPLRRILMVGSGPLPMTSVQLINNGGEDLTVDNLDISEEAAQIGEQITSRLGLNQQMRFLTGDILKSVELGDYDAIWLAALAGDSHNKARLVNHLYQCMSPGALLLVRTACDLRGLIYPVVTTQDLSPFTLRLKLQTYSDNFHSVYVVQR